MRVLIDTNIILDVLCNRPDFVHDSSMVMKKCEVGMLDGYISAMSIPNIVYIMRKELTNEKAVEIINNFNLIFNIEDLKAADIAKASALDFSDFEDAIQSVCASRIKAQYIVSRNVRDYKNSKVPVITPSELLRIM